MQKVPFLLQQNHINELKSHNRPQNQFSNTQLTDLLAIVMGKIHQNYQNNRDKINNFQKESILFRDNENNETNNQQNGSNQNQDQYNSLEQINKKLDRIDQKLESIERVSLNEQNRSINLQPLQRNTNVKDKPTSNCRTFKITNQNSVKKLRYGTQFTAKLDPRDQMMEHLFKFQIKKQMEIIQSSKNDDSDSFLSTKCCKNICRQIEEYLVDVIQNIVSVSFNLLVDGKLKVNECKDYASKNILMNVHSVLKEIFQTLQKQKIISKEQEIRECNTYFSEFANHTIKQILTNLIGYYPQSPPTGATPKMKEALLSINRSDNEFLDFIMTQNLTLKEQKSGDYTEYIMKVINRVISVTSQSLKEDLKQQTLSEKFIDFNKRIFWLSESDKNFQKLSKSEILKQFNKQTKKSSLFCSSSNVDQQNALQQFLQGLDERSILEKGAHQQNYHIGQKLPNNVPSFSRQDIKHKRFSAKHSSVLRILTKWAEALQDIFDCPQKYTVDRVYPFKNLTHEIIHLDQQKRTQLLGKLKKAALNQNIIKTQLINRNIIFEGVFFGQQNESFSKYIKRYTKTRVIASKMNNLLVHIMKEYVSKLIYLLVEAGKLTIKITKKQQQIQKGNILTNFMNIKKQEKKEQLAKQNCFEIKGRFKQSDKKELQKTNQININLVLFRISDLLRSKIYCNQASFIRLLHILYELDKANSQMKPMFELVRIKNKLDTKDSNILITYLFMGKLQCQLQMSIQRMDKKQQYYNQFNHFLYQLTRGKFGILSECAIIIAQHDPIIAAQTNTQTYRPSQKKLNFKKEKYKGVLQINQNQNNLTENKVEIMFVCSICNSLNMVQQKARNQFGIIGKCKKCTMSEHSIIKTQKAEIINSIESENIKNKIKQYQTNTFIKQISNYSQLMKIKQIITEAGQFILLTLTNKQDQFEYHLIGYQKTQNYFYSQPLSLNLLQKRTLKIEDLQYSNITDSVLKQKQFPWFTFIAQLKANNILDIFSMIKFQKNISQDKYHQQKLKIQIKIQDIHTLIRSDIMKKNILDTLNNKNQTLVFRNSQKFKLMENIQSQKGIIGASIQEGFQNVQLIFAQKLQLQYIPSWLQRLSRLKFLNLGYNKLKDISSIVKHCNLLQQFIITSNNIQYIDWKQFAQNGPHLRVLDINNNKLAEVILQGFTGLVNLNLIDIDSLEFIKLSDCKQLKIVTYQGDLKNVSSLLHSFNIMDCQNLRIIQIYNTPNLQTVEIKGCNSIQKFILPKEYKYKFANFDSSQWVNLQILNIAFEDETVRLDGLSLINVNINGSNNLINLYVNKCPYLQKLRVANNSLLQKIQCFQNRRIQKFISHNNPCLIEVIMKIHPSLKSVKIRKSSLFVSLKMTEVSSIQKIIIKQKIYNHLRILQIPEDVPKLRKIKLSHQALLEDKSKQHLERILARIHFENNNQAFDKADQDSENEEKLEYIADFQDQIEMKKYIAEYLQ